jgi:hypothetical protein
MKTFKIHESQKWLNKMSLNKLLNTISWKYTRYSSMAQNTLITRSFMHGWTIWHAIVFYKMDSGQNEFIMLGTNYWYWKIVKHLHASLDWKYFQQNVTYCFTQGLKNFLQQFLLSSHHLSDNIKKYVICYEIQQWFTSCTHHLMGCRNK